MKTSMPISNLPKFSGYKKESPFYNDENKKVMVEICMRFSQDLSLLSALKL